MAVIPVLGPLSGEPVLILVCICAAIIGLAIVTRRIG